MSTLNEICNKTIRRSTVRGNSMNSVVNTSWSWTHVKCCEVRLNFMLLIWWWHFCASCIYRAATRGAVTTGLALFWRHRVVSFSWPSWSE